LAMSLPGPSIAQSSAGFAPPSILWNPPVGREVTPSADRAALATAVTRCVASLSSDGSGGKIQSGPREARVRAGFKFLCRYGPPSFLLRRSKSSSLPGRHCWIPSAAESRGYCGNSGARFQWILNKARKVCQRVVRRLRDFVASTYIGGAILPSLLSRSALFLQGSGSKRSDSVRARNVCELSKGDNGTGQGKLRGRSSEALAAANLKSLLSRQKSRRSELTFENALIGSSICVVNLLQICPSAGVRRVFS